MDAIDLMDLAKLLVTLIDVEAMRAENEVAACEKALPHGKVAFLGQRKYAEEVLEHIQYRENRG